MEQADLLRRVIDVLEDQEDVSFSTLGETSSSLFRLVRDNRHVTNRVSSAGSAFHVSW